MHPYRLSPVLVLFALLGCGPQGPESDVPAPEAKSIYVTDGVTHWSAGTQISVNGESCTLQLLEGDLALVEPEGAYEYSLLYPASASFEEGSYRTRIPQSQTFIRGGIDPTTIIAVDWIRRGSFKFETSNLVNICPYLKVALYAVGDIRASAAQIYALDGSPLAGEVMVNCKERTLKTSAGVGAVTLSLAAESSPLHLSTDSQSPDTLTFAILPGYYQRGLKLVLHCTDGRLLETQIPGPLRIAIEDEIFAGTLGLSDQSSLTNLNVSLTGDIRGDVDWQIGTAANINGTVSYAISAEGGVLTFPVTRADSYTIAYPATSTIDGQDVSFEVPAIQTYGETFPAQTPVMAGSGAGPSVSLSQISGMIRIRMFTEPGVVRKIASLTLVGEGINNEGRITITPQQPFTESTAQTAANNVSFFLAPGTYRDVRLIVRGFDASYPVPEYYTEEDLLQDITYSIGDIVITPEAIRLANIKAQVVQYDWMRANGTPHINVMDLDKSLAAYINTGYIVPAASDHSVEYECTMSGAIKDFRVQKAVFGSHGGSVGKPAVWAYNQTEKSGWYHIMGSVAGMETYKQEKNAQGKPNGKVFHVDKELADKRIVQMGCEGKVNSSYIWCRWKNLTAGDTEWTELYEKSDYFLLKKATLRCEHPIILFGYNKTGQVAGANNEIAIYNFRISYDGSVVMDLSPCSVDGVPAMKDRISGKYFFNASPAVQVITNSGSLSPFILGND